MSIFSHSEVRPLRRYCKLPYGYAVSFEWNTAKQRVDVNWSELPQIRSKKAQRRFFEAYAAVRTEFLTEVAHITGKSILIADPAIGRMETIDRPTGAVMKPLADDRPKTLPDGSIVRQTPWDAAGMSRASWYRHGKPEVRPKRQTRAELARSIGISVRTVYRAARKVNDERRARYLQYQGDEARRLIEKHPSKSDDQIFEMLKAHLAGLTDEQLGKIMSPT